VAKTRVAILIAKFSIIMKSINDTSL